MPLTMQISQQDFDFVVTSLKDIAAAYKELSKTTDDPDEQEEYEAASRTTLNKAIMLESDKLILFQ